MAVYKRNYRTYTGVVTNPVWRFFVLTRYAIADIFSVRFFGAGFVLCFLPALFCASYVYVSHSEVAQAMLNMKSNFMPAVDSRFFINLLRIEGFLAFALACQTAPGLIAADLANNALPLFFSRPISRAEYVLGKMAAILILLSCITWIPGLLVFALQVNLDTHAWFAANWWIATSFFTGALIWIVLLALLALAISAWVKWRIVASLSMVMFFFVPAGMGEIFNAVTRTPWGRLLNFSYLITVIWSDLFNDVLNFRASVIRGPRIHGVRPSSLIDQNIPVEMAWIAVLAFCTFCLWMLHQKLRAREVVRG